MVLITNILKTQLGQPITNPIRKVTVLYSLNKRLYRNKKFTETSDNIHSYSWFMVKDLL